MARGSALAYPTPDAGRTNWPCHQHTRYSLRGRAWEVSGLGEPPKIPEARTPRPASPGQSQGPLSPRFLTVCHHLSVPGATSALQGPVGPHTTRENGRCLRGFAATKEKPLSVLNGLWIWKESPPRVGSRWEADVGCWKSLLQRPGPTSENPSLSLPKAEGKATAQTPWEPQLRAQSAQRSLPFFFSLSFALLFLLHSCRIRLSVLLASPLPLPALSLCLPVPLRFSHYIPDFMAMPVSLCLLLSQTVSDSMSVLGLWLALPPSSWLLPKASVLPSMLG